MRGHLSQLRENAVDVLVGIDEGDHDGQFASGFDEVRGVDAASSEKAGDGVKGDGSEDIFFAQVFQDLHVMADHGAGEGRCRPVTTRDWQARGQIRRGSPAGAS